MQMQESLSEFLNKKSASIRQIRLIRLSTLSNLQLVNLDTKLLKNTYLAQQNSIIETIQ